MRVPWSNLKSLQLDLLSADPAPVQNSNPDPVVGGEPNLLSARTVFIGQPLIVSTASLFEDPNNPRTEFPQVELEELAEDIRRHGILQPIVVHPTDGAGRYQIHFGAKRWRAAQLAELLEVPIVVRDAPADPYAQVAENQKRCGLTPLDLARFIRGRVDAGDSNSAVAKRLGMNLTTVANHLAMLELPVELDELMKSGRVTSPRTLRELTKLHDEQPEQVRTLLSRGAELTRSQVSAARGAHKSGRASDAAMPSANKLVKQVNDACERLERALGRIQAFSPKQPALPELIALRTRIEGLTKHLQQGSDCQTPPTS